MPFKLKTREYDRQGSRVTLRKVTDYLCVRFSGYAIYLSKGGAYSEGGDAYKPLPEGFFAHLAKLNPKALAAVGWTEEVIEAAKTGGTPKKPQPAAEAPVSPATPDNANPLDPRNAEETQEKGTPGADYLTREQAEALTYAMLSTYAERFNIKDRSKQALLDKLEMAGYLAE